MSATDLDVFTKTSTGGKYGDVSDEKLLRSLGVAGYNVPGTEGGLFSGAYDKMLTEATSRGIVDQIPEYNFSDVIKNIGAFTSTTGRDKTQTLKKIQMIEGVARGVEDAAARDESINLARDAFNKFLEDKSYEGLLERIRSLPATLGDEDVELLRRQAYAQARMDETARLRRVISATGLRGLGNASGAIAALATQTAALADRQIDNAIRQIMFEKMQADRSDELQAIGAEQALLGERQTRELQLQQNLSNLLDPNYSGPNQYLEPISGFSNFLAASEVARAAEEADRDRSRSALVGAGIGALGTIGGALIGGPPGAALGSQIGSYAGYQASGQASGAIGAGANNIWNNLPW